jgi:hypothetical protein
MAVTIETPVRRRIKLQRRLFLVPISAVGALLLALSVVLLFIAISGLAPAPSGHRTGTPIVVPHPSPGPFGS